MEGGYLLYLRGRGGECFLRGYGVQDVLEIRILTIKRKIKMKVREVSFSSRKALGYTCSPLL